MTKVLPHLTLDVHASHITQEMTDQIIDYLVKHYPDSIEKIAMYERGYTDGNTIAAYAESMHPIITEISQIMHTPDCELGYIELNFELLKRCRAAYGYRLPEVRGKPLAPSIKGPYPEKLTRNPILYRSVFRAGFSQEQFDSWGDEFYNNDKESCYQKAEADRRGVFSLYLRKRDPINLYFRKKVEQTGDEKITRHYSMASSEFVALIALTCELITPKDLHLLRINKTRLMKRCLLIKGFNPPDTCSYLLQCMGTFRLSFRSSENLGCC